MTSATLASARSSRFPASSRGVSAEAQRIGALLDEERNPRTSVLLGEPIRRLNLACGEAREVGWDGPGSQPVSNATYRRVRAFLDAIQTAAPAPEFWIDEDGDVVVEWWSAPRCVFAVVVSDSSLLHFSGIFGSETAYGSAHFSDALPPSVGHGLRRYLDASSRRQGAPR